MARRRFQRGRVFLRGERNPVWVARWREDVEGPDGKLERVHRSEILATKKECPTKRLAERKLAEFMVQVNRDTVLPKLTVTFAEFCARWEQTVLPQHKAGSRNSEKPHLVRLKAFFGNYRFSDIHPEMVQRFVTDLQQVEKLEPKTIRNIMTTFKLVWKAAKGWGYALHSPWEGVRMPKVYKKEQPYLTSEQMQELIRRTEDEKLRLVYRTLAESAVRAGEVVSLRVMDIDILNQLIYVRQNYSHKEYNVPKNGKPRRLDMSPQLARDLAKFTVGRDPESLVFATKHGKPLDQRFLVRTMKKTLKAMGVQLPPRIGLHAIRHGNASVMDDLNVPLKLRQDRLGHSSYDPNLTLGVYTHKKEGAGKVVVAEMGKLFDPQNLGFVPNCAQDGKTAAAGD